LRKNSPLRIEEPFAKIYPDRTAKRIQYRSIRQV
jgi:hypothetical protein